MNLGKFGVRIMADTMPAAASAALAARAETWGYGGVWIPEAFGRNALAHAAYLLSKTTRMNVVTGIANIYARDSLAAVGAQNALNEQWDGRFLLGLGVSHVPIVEGFRGAKYDKPVEAMTAYLEGMKKVKYGAPAPKEPSKTIIAALGPKMLEVAAKHADGAHPYLTTPAHTADARKILGPGKLLCPEQLVLLETDPAKARDIGRQQISQPLQLPNYRNSIKRQGFSDADIDSVSDRLVDALVAWGTREQILEKIQKQFDAGADHVIINSIPWVMAGGGGAPSEKVFEVMAPGQ